LAGLSFDADRTADGLFAMAAQPQRKAGAPPDPCLVGR